LSRVITYSTLACLLLWVLAGLLYLGALPSAAISVAFFAYILTFVLLVSFVFIWILNS